jgi:uncharacterized protein (TIGR02145 family)
MRKKQLKNLTIAVPAILFLCTMNISAQVNIGSIDPPHTAAILDLSQKEATAPDRGLLLPRVLLTNLDDFQLIADPTDDQKSKAAGMIVYNLTEDDDDLPPGVYMWDGAKWGRINDGRTFTKNSKVKSDPTLSGKEWLVFMTYNLGADLQTIDDQLAAERIETDGSQGYTGQPSSTDAQAFKSLYGDLYQWGRTNDGHELVYSSSYNTTTQVPASSIDASNYQVGLNEPGYGEFIEGNDDDNWGDWIQDLSSGSLPVYDPTYKMYPNRWNGEIHATNPTGNFSKGPGDPCPAGWRVPTQTEWQSIIGASSFSGSTYEGTNRWEWYDGTTANGGNHPSGWRIYRPTSSATWAGSSYSAYETEVAMFLPAAGARDYESGQLGEAGSGGYYWSSTVLDSGSYLLLSGSSGVSMFAHFRSIGLSVRCVEE